MKNKLGTLFEYQKYEGNSELQQVIDSTHSRWQSRELDLDEMEKVSAAGIPEFIKQNLGGQSGQNAKG